MAQRTWRDGRAARADDPQVTGSGGDDAELRRVAAAEGSGPVV